MEGQEQEKEVVGTEKVAKEKKTKAEKEVVGTEPTMVKYAHYKVQKFAGHEVKIPETSINPEQVYSIAEAPAIIEALALQGILSDEIEKF